MKHTYLFAGASSLIAIKTAEILQEEGHRVIGLSTKEKNHGYDEFFTIPDYQANSLPALADELDGLVYFPGTINLKPFNRLTAADFQTDLQISVLGAIACLQTYLPNLKKESACVRRPAQYGCRADRHALSCLCIHGKGRCGRTHACPCG